MSGAGDPEGRWERMKQRLKEYGPQIFFDEELIEGLLFYVLRRQPDRETAVSMKRHFIFLSRLLAASPAELEQFREISRKDAQSLYLAFLLCERAIAERRGKRILSSPARAAAFLAPIFRESPRETSMVVCLRDDLSFMSCHTLFEGTASETKNDPYRAIRCALEEDCGVMLLTHNHPFEPPVPSDSDIYTTGMFLDSLRPLGITLLDHIVIGGEGRYCSFAENGFFREEKEPIREVYWKGRKEVPGAPPQGSEN